MTSDTLDILLTMVAIPAVYYVGYRHGFDDAKERISAILRKMVK